MPLLSVTFATLDRLPLLKNSINDLRKKIKIEKEIIVVYSSEDKNTANWLKEQNDIISLPEVIPNSGIAKNYNLAFKNAKGKYVTSWNDDNRLPLGIDIFEIAISYLEEHKEAGAIAFPYFGEDGVCYIHEVQYRGKTRPFLSFGVIRLDLIRQIGYLNEYYNHYFPFPELCVEIYERGFDIVVLKRCKAAHIVIKDSTREKMNSTWDRDRLFYAKKWAGIISVATNRIRIEDSHIKFY